jgi:hypothetical protein
VTTPKTIENYGGPYEDAEPVANPQTEMAADFGNTLLEDVAQLTRMGSRARVSFVPVATAAVVAVVVASHRSVWGSSDTQKPTISKTATGVYAITWPSTQIDGNGVVETLAFTGASAGIVHASTNYPDPRVQSVTANVVTVRVTNNAAPPVNADITDSTVTVWAE